jgi:hypothetical protein
MSKHTHTPGPWISDDAGPQDLYRNIITVGPNATDFQVLARLALPIKFDKTREEQEANARLMAASPDLLDALREMYHAFLDADNTHNDRQEAASLKACAAIFKATGGIT